MLIIVGAIENQHEPTRLASICKTVFSRQLLVATSTKRLENNRNDVIHFVCHTRCNVYLYLKLSIFIWLRYRLCPGHTVATCLRF